MIQCIHADLKEGKWQRCTTTVLSDVLFDIFVSKIRKQKRHCVENVNKFQHNA
jgi:hypothetical protein